MKAIVRDEYGTPDVLRLQEVEVPVPQANEVLVKVQAASLNAADCYLLKGSPIFLRFETGLSKPKNKMIGSDIAGRIEAVGRDVQQFKVGDEVYADLSGDGSNGFAEYVCVPEAILAHKPTTATFAQAAAVPMAAVTALQALRDNGKIEAGEKVLINGASGGVGTFAVQIAKAYGAEVTGVCSSSKLEMVRSLGADHVIDYTEENFTENGKQYDLILAANGYHPVSAYKRALSPDGVCVTSGGTMKQIFGAMLLGKLVVRGGQRIESMIAKPSAKDLQYMADLIDAGKVVPYVDKEYPLAEAAEAFRYVAAGRARGKVVITM